MLELALLTFTSTSAADLKAKDLLAAAYATFYIKIHIKISLNYLNSGHPPFSAIQSRAGKAAAKPPWLGRQYLQSL